MSDDDKRPLPAYDAMPAHPDFYSRKQSDRFDAALSPKNPIVVRNATIWTGEVAKGLEIVFGDVLLDKGIIKAVGKIGPVKGRIDEIQANGAWVTAGLVDLHSHLGDNPSPTLAGAVDGNSLKGLTQPWLRSLDGLNTHDESYRLSAAGGLTTALVLPGSANAIGGQAFPIKLRPTSEKSTSSMLLESPFESPSHWRHLKQACGENPSRVYSGTRMDTIWSFRAAYEEARKLKEKQDEYCQKVKAGRWDSIRDEAFPDDLQWEALVDVLRGKVKIQNHCYEAVDFDGIVRLSNEFNFSIAGFHHAHEAYLVPDLSKKTYGHTPVVALFATWARYKRESYRGSEFAPKVLSDSGIEVVMKSDHPGLNSRYLLHEAQQAHYYGLPANLALASVTTTPARAAGLDHRVGKVKKGYDAGVVDKKLFEPDLVIWDAHPLALGATPIQVYIDGIPQLPSKSSAHSDPHKEQKAPKTPNFDKEAHEAVDADGLPSLQPQQKKGRVVFNGLKSVYMRNAGKVVEVFRTMDATKRASVVVQAGTICCVSGFASGIVNVKTCSSGDLDTTGDATRIDLDGGSLAPALSTVGSPLGLRHIAGESSIGDGNVDRKVTGQDINRAADGLLFQTRDALLAYRSGVTTAITPPSLGLVTAFSTGAKHKLDKEAILSEETAFHVSVSLGAEESVSTQIRNLRKGLLGAVNGGEGGDLGKAFKRVVEGEIPLLVTVESADIIATIIKLKGEVESALANNSKKIRVTLVGAKEAHLLASEIAEAGVGVIVAPVRPFPRTWESLRILPGPPLSEKTAVSTLMKHNVTVAVASDTSQTWTTRNTRWDVAWVSGLLPHRAEEDTEFPKIALDSQGMLSRSEALELASTKVEELAGLNGKDDGRDLVVTSGGELLEFEGKVVGVVSSKKGVVDLLI
ncbi:hypothetical protein V5O48_008666 [Marasmius crinis-equi]|uniref:Amidohydrolase-related domain-containing protein n=1 Tax=Marasmius crinis-equi TaxID=585013 RepID=A0ABR3FD87_9AGAR